MEQRHLASGIWKDPDPAFLVWKVLSSLNTCPAVNCLPPAASLQPPASSSTLLPCSGLQPEERLAPQDTASSISSSPTMHTRALEILRGLTILDRPVKVGPCHPKAHHHKAASKVRIQHSTTWQ